MTRKQTLFRPFSRFSRQERGAATIEFVIWFPLFVTLLLSSVESGLVMVRHVMLERGLDLTVRSLRLGLWTAPEHDDLKAAICDAAGILPDCAASLTLELVPVSTQTWQMPAGPVPCIDRSETIQPVTQLVPGAGNEMMLIRVCAKFTPLFPTTGVGLGLQKDGAGQYALVSASAFVNEP